jgi:hypothetical protein
MQTKSWLVNSLAAPKLLYPRLSTTTTVDIVGRKKMISLWWALVAFWVGGFAGVLLVALMLVSRAAFGSGSAAD